MSLELSGLLILREELEGASRDANEWILQHCFYCKNCRACSINSSLQKELKRNNFRTKNKHVKWGRLHFVNDLPIFFSYGFEKSKPQILYSYSKQQIPDALVSTSFKKHYTDIINEKNKK